MPSANRWRSNVRWLTAVLSSFLLAACGNNSHSIDAARSPDSQDLATETGANVDLAPEPHDLLETSIAPDTIEDLPAPPGDISSDGPDTTTTPWPAPVPMQIVDGLPLIAGSYDDSVVLPYIIDTLSQICFVDDDLIGDFLYHEVVATFGNDTLVDLLVKGREMEPDEQYLGLDIGGLIGQSYFQQRFVVLDFPGGSFYSFATARDLATNPVPGHAGEPVTEVSVAQQNAFPVVTVALGEGIEAPLLADTSSRVSVITQSIFDQLNDGSLPQAYGYRFTSKYGEDAGFLTRLPAVTVGTMTVTGLEAVVIPDEHHLVAVLEPSGVFVEGYLGAQFWNRFALAIDAFGGDEFTPQLFTLVGDGSEPEGWQERWHKVGLELSWSEGLLFVEMVYLGSSAESEGFEVGDMLVMIDGEKYDGMTLEQARAKLHGALGQSIELIVSKPMSDELFSANVLVEEILP